MNIKKNWFTVFVISIYGICMFYALFSGILNIGVSKDYPYLWYGGFFAASILLFFTVYILSMAASSSNFSSFFSSKKLRNTVTEAVLAAAVISIGAAARIWVIQNIPISPSSDYQTYYQVAEMLSKGTLISDGSGLCDYISEFPHVIGYPFILSILFKITGPSVTAGLYLNLAASVISIFLVYRIARLLCGRAGGLIALMAAALWPSQILYSNMLASEPVFTCMMLFAVFIAMHLFYYPALTGKISTCVIISIALGIMIALSAAVRPMSLILLIAIVLCLLSCRVKFGKVRNEIGVFRRAVCQGWFRAALILVAYLICSQIISGSIERTIDRTLPSGSVSFGYNLLVGVNIDTNGTWSENDSLLLSNTYTATGSAQAAHKACFDKALTRIYDDPAGILNLTLKKFASLWGNDDYGASWNLLFLSQQKHLTPALKNMINSVALWNNIIYLICLFFSALAGGFLWRRKNGSPAQMLILFFIGTAIVQMVLESQNRYHYNILPVFMILASFGITEIYHGFFRKPDVEEAKGISAAGDTLKQADARQPQAAQPSQFNMTQAIMDGHVTVTVTDSYRKEAERDKSN